MNAFTPRIAADWHQTLEAVMRHAQRPGAPVVVFDLDSTVFDNRPRQARIIREYGATVGLPALTKCHALHLTDGGWDLAAPFRAFDLSAEYEAHALALKRFWATRFFSSEYCIDDIEVVGAPRYLSLLARTGARIVYVTGRHEAMREGSVRCFAKCGLPCPTTDGAVTLLMKAALSDEDDSYKRGAHTRLRAMGEVIAAFDNEPTHVNDYATAFPEALAVHLATDHSGRPVQLEARVISIPHFAY